MNMTVSISQTRDRTSILYPNEDIRTEFSSTSTLHYEALDDYYKTPDSTTYIYTTDGSMCTDSFTVGTFYDAYETVNSIESITMACYIGTYDYPPTQNTTAYLGITDDNFATNEDWSSNYQLVQGYTRKIKSYTTNPFTGVAFTTDDISSLQYAIKVKSEALIAPTNTCFVKVDSAGDKTQASPSVVGRSNWQCVDTYSSDYVYTDTSNAEDLYNLEDSCSCATADANCTITKVTVIGKFGHDGGYGYVYGGIKTGGTEYWKVGEQYAINAGGTSYKTFQWEWDTNPDTASSWTWSDIDSLQIGFSMFATSLTVECREIYLKIDYACDPLYPEIRATSFFTKIKYNSTEEVDFDTITDVSTNHDRNVNMFNFWNGEREVYDVNRNSKKTVITGAMYDGTCSDCTVTTNYSAATTSTYCFNDVEVTNGSIANVENYDCDENTYASNNSTGVEYIRHTNLALDVPSTASISKVEIRSKFYINHGSGSPTQIRWRAYGHLASGYQQWEDKSGDYAAQYTDWTELTEPTNGWTLTDLGNLYNETLAYIDPYGSGSSYRLYKLEVRITYYTVDSFSYTVCPCTKIQRIREMGRSNAPVTISGLNPCYFNGDYRITSFGWNKISEKPEHYKFILELEDTEA